MINSNYKMAGFVGFFADFRIGIRLYESPTIKRKGPLRPPLSL